MAAEGFVANYIGTYGLTMKKLRLRDDGMVRSPLATSNPPPPPAPPPGFAAARLLLLPRLSA